MVRVNRHRFVGLYLPLEHPQLVVHTRRNLCIPIILPAIEPQEKDVSQVCTFLQCLQGCIGVITTGGVVTDGQLGVRAALIVLAAQASENCVHT